MKPSLTLLEGSEINNLKEKEKPFIIIWKDNNTPYVLRPLSHPFPPSRYCKEAAAGGARAAA